MKRITSLELLEQINFYRKQDKKKDRGHNDLLLIIETEFTGIRRAEISDNYSKIKEKLVKENIKVGEYTLPGGNQKYIMYILTISQAKQVLFKESRFVRRAVIKFLEEINGYSKKSSQ